MKVKSGLSVGAMVRIALLSVIGFILMQLDLRLPIFPAFLALDAGDVPCVIGAVVMGPLAGVTISLIKNLLDLIIMGTTTGSIGELANFVIGSFLIVPIGLICKKNKDPRRYLIGCAAGLPFMVLAACLMNYFVLLPMYSRLLFPMEKIIEITSRVNVYVTDVRSLITFAILPFNLLKGALTVTLGYVLYRALRPVLVSYQKKDL